MSRYPKRDYARDYMGRRDYRRKLPDKCPRCGRPIQHINIKGKRGQRQIVDPGQGIYCPSPNGEPFVTEWGSLNHGVPATDGLTGYRPHTCPPPKPRIPSPGI